MSYACDFEKGMKKPTDFVNFTFDIFTFIVCDNKIKSHRTTSWQLLESVVQI